MRELYGKVNTASTVRRAAPHVEIQVTYTHRRRRRCTKNEPYECSQSGLQMHEIASIRWLNSQIPKFSCLPKISVVKELKDSFDSRLPRCF